MQVIKNEINAGYEDVFLVFQVLLMNTMRTFFLDNFFA